MIATKEEITQLMREGEKMYRAGDLSRAEELYRAVLSKKPLQPRSNFLLGTIILARGLPVQAKPFAQSAAKSRPDCWRYHSALARVLAKIEGQETACVASHAEAARLHPSVSALRNLGLAQTKVTEDHEGAEKSFRAAIRAHSGESSDRTPAVNPTGTGASVDPESASIRLSSLWYLLGQSCKRQNKCAAAASCYARVLELEPTHEKAAYKLASMPEGVSAMGSAGLPVVARAPASYVASLFDGYAASFESHLVEKLRYSTPSLISAELKSAFPSGHRWQRCVDFGCGTGLSGRAVRSQVGFLGGIDLSSKMVDKAGEGGGYDALAVGDVTDIAGKLLHGHTSNNPPLLFDLAISCDVFVYIGDLGDVFSSICEVCTPDFVFAFSTEHLDEAPQTPTATTVEEVSDNCDENRELNCALSAAAYGAEAPEGLSGVDYALLNTKRFAHSVSYILRLAKFHGLKCIKHRTTTIRYNAGTPIVGDIFILERKSIRK